MTSVARLAPVLVSLMATPACSFKDYEYRPDFSTSGGAGGMASTPAENGASETCPDDSGAVCEPACVGLPNPDSNDVPSPVIHWSFDSDATAPLYDENNSYALTLHTEVSGAYNPIDNRVRMNGHGNSIYLDGFHYYATDGVARDPLIQTGGTVAALISISHDTLPLSDAGDTTIWPIVSTLSTSDSSSCGGFQLDIRRDAAQGLAVAFSYAYAAPDVSSGCRTATHSLPLNKPSWAWSTGHWHHVAATYIPQGTQARVALYWDSDSPNARRHSEAIFDGQMPETAQTLYIGTNADQANDRVSMKFKGGIDEVALFATPLEAVQLAQFTANTTTYPGPSRCRWQVTEAHQDGVDAGTSTTKWLIHDTTQLQVEVHDEDWGAGSVAARLAPPGTGRNLTSYGSIMLTADGLDTSDTPNGSFEFSLSAGDSSCTWYIAPGGAEAFGPKIYRIDLASPDYCQSASCQFPIDNVEWASIRSSWEYFPSFDTWTTNQLTYTIYRLDLVEGTTSIDPTRYGGEIGINNWCWRTQAFQAAYDAAATFQVDAGLNVDTVDVILRGQKHSGSAVVADFGDNTLDLTNCTKIVLDGTLDPSERIDSSGGYPAVNFQDLSGLWQQWNWIDNTIPISGVPAATSAASSEKYVGAEQYVGIWPWQPYANFPKVFDRQRVTSLSIQKNWLWPDQNHKSATDARLTVRGVQFLDQNNVPHCEILNYQR